MPKVFVHGNPESAAIWMSLDRALRERGVDDIVLLSPPGFGTPSPEGWSATPLDYRSWLVSELEALGGAVDLLGHDWGAGHVYGLLDHRPDLVRTWAADCVGLLHADYVWHDAAQAWQTPDVGEEVVAAMFGTPVADRVAMLVGLGITEAAAADVAEWMNEDMGRCVLALYRGASQPYMADLGTRLATAELPPGLVIIAPGDHYAGSVETMQDQASAMGAQTVTLDGQNHWWMFEGADAAADALIGHWG